MRRREKLYDDRMELSVRRLLGVGAAVGALVIGSAGSGPSHRRTTWDTAGAVGYLDVRTKAWMRGGAMDRGTFCISCHTAMPYALARPAVRSLMGEKEPAG